MEDLKALLASSLRTDVARRERRLFDELNPDMDHTPILREPPRRPRPAAVLIGIRTGSEPSIVMTLRSPTMPSHAGQISLPGGTPKEGDDGAVGTALREAHEEVGVGQELIEIVGEIGPHYGGLGYVVTPVVGLIHPSARVDACPREVSEAFEVPLSALVEPGNHIIEERLFSGVAYNMYAVPVLDTEGRERNIWGLTAGILRTFCEAYRAA